MRKGWFKIAGLQDGDRSVEEQLRGLDPVMDGIAGKSVLDLGCAEGCVLKRAIERGCGRAVGYEMNPDFLATAREVLAGTPAEIVDCDLNQLGDPRLAVQFDVVLALAILHKLHEPVAALAVLAPIARELFVVRLPVGSQGQFHSKHRAHKVIDLGVEMPRHGFKLERTEIGPRTERVQYWRRA